MIYNRDSMVQTFKQAWHSADAEGDTGNRVARGLEAVFRLITPSRSQWQNMIAVERERQVELGYGEAHDIFHGADHLLRWAQDYIRVGKVVEAAALIEAAREILPAEALRGVGSAAEPILIGDPTSIDPYGRNDESSTE